MMSGETEEESNEKVRVPRGVLTTEMIRVGADEPLTKAPNKSE